MYVLQFAHVVNVQNPEDLLLCWNSDFFTGLEWYQSRNSATLVIGTVFEAKPVGDESNEVFQKGEAQRRSQIFVNQELESVFFERWALSWGWILRSLAAVPELEFLKQGGRDLFCSRDETKVVLDCD
ncbi:unnamed protein product [Toxocara canis]|uniref:Uncharacterized protein n=1 Tax=Toxocara canis TaxID=6265 RepID=A0A183UZJ3_TOXCA|nr:unnamed protein product [Toxocara canis]